MTSPWPDDPIEPLPEPIPEGPTPTDPETPAPVPLTPEPW